MNKAATGAVDVRYQKERYGYNQRQHKQQGGLYSSATRSIPDQKVAADGDRYHQAPSRLWNAIPPCGLSVSLRVQNVVHTRNGERDHGRRLRRSWILYCGPHLVLYLSCISINLLKFALIACSVKRNAKIEILSQQ